MRVVQGWIASLSNGETILEEPPVPGEKSSWQKLIDRLGEEPGLELRGLQLQRGDTLITALPFWKVQGYCMAYEAHKIMFRDANVLMQGIGSIVNGDVFMTWIDQRGNVRQDLRPLSEMKVHSSLRDANYATQGPGTEQTVI